MHWGIVTAPSDSSRSIPSAPPTVPFPLGAIDLDTPEAYERYLGSRTADGALTVDYGSTSALTRSGG